MFLTSNHIYHNNIQDIDVREFLIREEQKDFYLVLFMFASQLYFYILDPSSLSIY